MTYINVVERLTAEDFKTSVNNKDEALLFGVKYAHGTDQSEFKIAFAKHKKYCVDNEQIATATKLLNKIELDKKSQYLKDETLVFHGMGMSFEAKKGYIGNHRIRAKFLNSDGIKCFIEVGTGKENDLMRCDHSIFNTSEKWNSLKERDRQEKNNYNDLERSKMGIKYTFNNLLKLVNKNFKCNFKNIVLEEYVLRTDIFTSVSPLNEVIQ